MTGRLARVAVFLALCPVLACYTPPEPNCGFVCGSGGACPDDYTCASDNVCHRNGSPADLTCSSGQAFDVLSSTAVDAQHVAVVFDAAPDPASANDPANFAIAGLSITGAAVTGATVTLVTSAQTAQAYTVVAANITRASDGVGLTNNTATFTGIAAFDVASAASLDATTMTVTFDAPPDSTQATALANYAVPGLALSGPPSLIGSTVMLTTTTQAAQEYTVTVTGVTRATDNEPLDTATAMFAGRNAFLVASAAATSHTSITVTFSAPPDPTAATTVGNYAVTGLTLSNPRLAGSTVTLTTTGQSNTSYTVTVSNVTRDADGEALATASAMFTGRLAFDVIGAASTGNTTMTVTFSDPPDMTAAMTAGNYAVTGLTLSSPVLAGSVVTLATSSQAGSTYTVDVSNVTRASDLETLGTSSAMFSGTPACPALAIMDDGTEGAGGQDLVISLIEPTAGGAIELYNTTAADLDLSTKTYQLVVPGTITLDLAASGVTVKSHGYSSVAWPAGFGDETAGGELVLYGSAGRTPADIDGFVCWDTDSNGSSAKADAMTATKWSGACAGALTGTAIERKTDVTGTLGTDYDPSSTRAPLTCP
ncbi:MAG TPA: hypothetical protein VGF94_12315 [Kofleriaceae bacterium]|jgi:hypothetical protein